MKLFEQGMFQVDPNATPELLRKKRERLAAMMPRYGQAKYIGEGIGQLLYGIGSGRSESRMDKYEGEKSAAATSQFDSFMGGPLNILGMSQMDASSGTQPASPAQGVADDTMAALGKPSMGGNGFAQGGNQQAFIEAMMPHAMRVSEQTGLDPRIVIAQAAQETGWGKSAPGNNYFGIKSHGKGGGNTFATNEVINGRTVRINDSFRGYGGMGESADGYASFLQENPRYKPMLAAGDLDGQVAALGASGYATDPNYARSVGSIANNIALPDGFTPGQGGNVTMSTQGQPAQGPSGGADMAGLMQMAANPWLSPEQRQVVNGMLQQAQGQQAAADDRYWKQQDPAYQQSLELGRIELDKARNPGAGFTNVTPDEVAALGLPPGAYQRGPDNRISQIGGGGTSVTVNNNPDGTPRDDKLRGKLMEAEGVQWGNALAAGQTASGMQQDMALLDQVIEMAPSGPLTGRIAEMFPGVSNAAGVFQSVVKRVAPSLRVEGSGSQSDVEYNGFLQSLPALSNRPEANRAISGMMRAKAAINMERAAAVAAYQNGEVDATTTRKKMQEIDKKSILSPELQNLLNGLGDGAAPDGGSAQGPDFEAFAATPSIIAAAEKYGVSIEEMWAIQRGQK